MYNLAEITRDRLVDGIRKYSRIVARAKEKGISEGDNRDLVRAMLGDLMGFDPFFDVTSESVVRGRHADFLVLPDSPMQFLVLVKHLSIMPHAAHLLRLSGLNTPAYTSWVVLTNADTWACYRLGVGNGRHPELVFRVSLSEGQSAEERIRLFGLLCKEGVEQDSLTRYWEQYRVLNPGRMTSLLLSEEVLHLLRREIQRQSSFRIDTSSLREILTQQVLRPDAVAATQGGEITQRPLPLCYAYAPQGSPESMWRLPYRNPDGSPNAELLARAMGDFQGDHHILGVPADDVPLVKERLRAAFLELGLRLDELPHSLT